jgi:hypothetical protein
LVEAVVRECGLTFSETKYKEVDGNGQPQGGFTPLHIVSYPTDGIKLSQHKNTWQRKRSTGYLICIEYVWKGRVVYKRVEPWVNYPSDMLIAQLTMLPREVK